MAAGALAVVALAGSGQAWAAGGEARQRDLFDDAYPQIVALDRLLTDPDLPVIYSGLGGQELTAHHWFHTNTFRVFATPLEELFGRRILDPLAGGPRRGPGAHRAGRGRAPGARGAGLSAQRPLGRRRQPARVRHRRPALAPVGSFTFTVPVLDRQPDPDDERWRVHQVTVDVTLVERA